MKTSKCVVKYIDTFSNVPAKLRNQLATVMAAYATTVNTSFTVARIRPSPNHDATVPNVVAFAAGAENIIRTKAKMVAGMKYVMYLLNFIYFYL